MMTVVGEQCTNITQVSRDTELTVNYSFSHCGGERGLPPAVHPLTWPCTEANECFRHQTDRCSCRGGWKTITGIRTVVRMLFCADIR